MAADGNLKHEGRKWAKRRAGSGVFHSNQAMRHNRVHGNEIMHTRDNHGGFHHATQRAECRETFPRLDHAKNKNKTSMAATNSATPTEPEVKVNMGRGPMHSLHQQQSPPKQASTAHLDGAVLRHLRRGDHVEVPLAEVLCPGRDATRSGLAGSGSSL